MRNHLARLAAVLLLACAGPRPYTAPQDHLDQYAKVTLVNITPMLLSVRLYDDAISCSDPVKLFDAPGGLALDETRVVHAKKGEPFTVGGWYLRGGYPTYTRCDVNTTFLPTGAEYQMVFKAQNGATTCGVMVLEGSGSDAQPLGADRVFVRAYNNAFANGGPWCKELTAQQRAALRRR